MSTAPISGQARDGLEQGARKEKNTFFHFEQIPQGEDEIALDDTFDFERYLSEPVFANTHVGRVPVGHPIAEAGNGMTECCAVTVGASATEETSDECGAAAADAIISESDYSSRADSDPDGCTDAAELNESSNSQNDAFDSPELPEEIGRQTSAWSVASGGPCRQATDFSECGGFEVSVPASGLCRQVTEQFWPSTCDGFNWQAAGRSGFTASNGLCQQITDQFLPTDFNLGEAMTPSAMVEEDGAAHSCQVDQVLTEAMPPCMVVMQMPMMYGMPAMPMMWPGMSGMPVMQMMPEKPPGAWLPAGEYLPAQPMSKRRNNWQKSKSLVTMAQEAQQRQRQEQYLRMQQQSGAVRAAQTEQIRMRQQQLLAQKQDKSAQDQSQKKEEESEQDKPEAMASSTEKEGRTTYMPKFCEYCGKGILPQFKFCQFCGASTAKTFAAYLKSAPESS